MSHMPAWARRWQRLLFDNGWLLPDNRQSSGAATPPFCSSLCTSRSCADAGSITASTRKA
ncbi:acyl-CoA dehydrogenase domain protein [Mycobacterium xenopi 3993]|nr:acyl-CoA dehydrogenase domain protein [Mycobacterium xenopi 3993]